MGAVRRLSSLGALMGLLVAVVPVKSPAAAADSCRNGFTEQVRCGAEVIPDGPVVITLDGPLRYGKLSDQQRRDLARLRKDGNPLVVQVPEGTATGEGGTALLLMADGRLVHPDATIDRLRPETLAELTDAGVCEENLLCGSVDRDLTGRQLIEEGFAADHSANVFDVDPGTTDSASTSPGSGNPNGKDAKDGEDTKDGEGDRGKGDEGNKGNKGAAGDAHGDRAAGDDVEAAGDSTSWAALWMGLLLVLLLLAFAVVIRRSRGPVTVGHRASPGRMAAVPAGGGARRRAPRDPQPVDGPAPAAARAGDESTTRLRVAATARHGRQVSARPAHTRTAVVRTELHPQGYIELDRVLYRAVWAEAGRPPPAPGGLVDVAEAPERDSDVLYAFPPTAARHAKGTPR